MQEGIARYAGMQTSPEWVPAGLGNLIMVLRTGANFPLATIEEQFLGQSNTLCRTYSALVFQELGDRYGFERLKSLIEQIEKDGDWVKAIEDLCEKPLSSIDLEMRNAILQRYADFITPVNVRIAPGILMAEFADTDQAKIERAWLFLKQKRYDGALRSLDDLLDAEAPPTSALLIAGQVAFHKGDAKLARDRIHVAVQLEELRGEKIISSEDYETFGKALKELGETDAAVDAFLKAAELNPYESSEHGAYGQALELLAQQDPKPRAYYDVLAKSLPARRADAKLRLELGQWHEEQGNLEDAFVHYKSAAGIRPDWIAVHRALAPLAKRLGKLDYAYASYSVLFKRRPTDLRVKTAMLECAKALGKSD